MAPVHVQFGNHDHPTQTNHSLYQLVFPERINYTFTHRDWHFAGLGSTDGVRFDGASINKAISHWVDENLPRPDKAKSLVLFAHFFTAKPFSTVPLTPTR